MAERDDVSTVLSVHAVTVTDTYWIKDADSDLTWDDVRFKKDYFSTLALKGDYNSFVSVQASRKSHTQELTNIGSFEKCWRLKDGVWWLYKQADALELFSEYFISLLGKRLGFTMAEYIPCNDYIRPKIRAIRAKDFTNGASIILEPLDAIMGEDVDTGRVSRLAPNFDNNMALIARGYPAKRSYGSDLLISDFNALLASGAYWKGYSENHTLPTITEELLKEIIQTTSLKVRTSEIVEYIMARYRHIRYSS